jgi:aminoglycoside phosphotransferase (APT) family kinase protein
MTSVEHATTVSDVVDLDAVAGWMDGEGFGRGPITDVTPLAGGTQNILLRFARDGRSYVLRRGPEHLRPRSNDTMRREMRVLRALAGSDVPHPGFIAGCPDESVLGGAAFYLMEPVDGFNPTISLPDRHAGDAGIRHEMGLRAVDALAALGAIDHDAVGLGDLGRPDGFLERQVPRWLNELESYSRHEGYPGPDIPGLDEVAAWLDANRPTAFTPGLSHGDFHLANLLFRFDGPGVAAIVDWEMCTVGDPLLDLGWLLTTWPDPESGERDAGTAVVTGALGTAGGLARPDELVARYSERTTRDLSAITWYEVLAGFKLGIVLEGTHARAFAGKAPQEVGDVLHATTLGLFERAVRRIHATT